MRRGPLPRPADRPTETERPGRWAARARGVRRRPHPSPRKETSRSLQPPADRLRQSPAPCSARFSFGQSRSYLYTIALRKPWRHIREKRAESLRHGRMCENGVAQVRIRQAGSFCHPASLPQSPMAPRRRISRSPASPKPRLIHGPSRSARYGSIRSSGDFLSQR
jgi:hypothetical protein